MAEKPKKRSTMVACPIDSPKVTTGKDVRSSGLSTETGAPDMPFVFSLSTEAQAAAPAPSGLRNLAGQIGIWISFKFCCV